MPVFLRRSTAESVEAPAEIQSVLKAEPVRYIPDREQRRPQQEGRSLHTVFRMILLHGNALLLLEYSRHALVAQIELLFEFIRVERLGIVLFKP